jgi:hypothetical protein
MTYKIHLKITKTYEFTVEADEDSIAIEKAELIAHRRKIDPNQTERIEGEIAMIEVPDLEHWSWGIKNIY